LSWVDQSAGGGGGGGTSVTVTQATATASQTDFSVTYTAGQLSVYLNGALLASADYTATNGTSVVLASGAASGDIFTAVAYDSATQITQGDTTVEVTDSGTGKIEFTVDNVEVADFTTGEVVFNETGANQDFRVESDTNANMLVVDAGVNKVGIGTNTFNTNGGVLQVSNGISFPATQSATTDANTLDDYEEGTWTPTVNSGSLSFSVASYTKVGRVVTVLFTFTVSTGGGGSFSLPFTSAGAMGGGVYCSGQDFAAGTTAPKIVVSGGDVYFRTVGDNVSFSVMSFTTSATFHGFATYFV
jgi:hypothetical protein